MKRFTKQFTKQAEQIQLRAAERRDLRDRLTTYMEYHPLPKHLATQSRRTTSRAAIDPVSNDSVWYLPHIPFGRSLVGASLVLVFMVVPVLAERAVPGDILYSVKVGFNEEVRSSVTRSPYGQIEWETERLNRRLAEAQVLAREGRLTEEHEAWVAEAVREHSNSARAGIERLREKDEDEAAMAEIALSALFDVHAAVLAAHKSATSSPERRNQIAEAIESSRSTEAQRESQRPSYLGLLARIETESERASLLLTNIAPAATQEELTSITRRLDDVGRKVESGIVAFEDGDEMAARTLLTEALSTTRKVITFMTSLEVRNSIALDTLVPVEYTKDELTELLSARLELVDQSYAYMMAVLTERSDDAVKEKALDALSRFPNKIESVSVSIANEEFEAAGVVIAELETITDDIMQMADIPSMQQHIEESENTIQPSGDTESSTTTATSSDITNEDVATSTDSDAGTTTDTTESI